MSPGCPVLQVGSVIPQGSEVVITPPIFFFFFLLSLPVRIQ
jgi:hypothetical protein